MKLDKPTIALIASLIAAATGGGNMIGGSTALDELRKDVTECRERLARVETMLQQQRWARRAEREEVPSALAK